MKELVRPLKGRRGIISIRVIIFIAVTSSLLLGLGYWSGFISKGIELITPERLEIINITGEQIFVYETLKISIINVGSKDVKLEYVVLNGNVIFYTSFVLDMEILYNFIAGEYMVIPYDSQVEIYVPYDTQNNPIAEIRLHTTLGNDFVRIYDLSEENELESEPTQEENSESQTSAEQVEIQSAFCTVFDGNWTIELKMKNTGTQTSTLIGVYINEIEVDYYDKSEVVSDAIVTNIAKNESIVSGQTVTKHIFIDPDRTWIILSSGTTVNVTVRSAGGKNYLKLIELV